MTKKTNTTFEQQLFKAADKLRKNIDAAEYKYVVLIYCQFYVYLLLTMTDKAI